jgi:hypothetical protein
MRRSSSVGLKVQLRFGRAAHVWLRASGQRDVDGRGESLRGGQLALGVRYRF